MTTLQQLQESAREKFANKIGYAVHDLIEYRGISDNGKYLSGENAKQFIFPIIDQLIAFTIEEVRKAVVLVLDNSWECDCKTKATEVFDELTSEQKEI